MLWVEYDYVIYCLRECGVEDLEHTETSDLLEYIAQCQTEYEELLEFTRNEKEVSEEFLNAQV
jgi:hypothetical protein